MKILDNDNVNDYEEDWNDREDKDIRQDRRGRSNITDTKDNLNKIKEFIQDSNWEHIPNNPLAYLKYEQLINI